MFDTSCDVYPIFLRLPKENIALLKFLLESYEELGILRTLDPDRGEVVILALNDTRSAVEELIKNLTSELELRFIPPPESLEDDWLLSASPELRSKN